MPTVAMAGQTQTNFIVENGYSILPHCLCGYCMVGRGEWTVDEAHVNGWGLSRSRMTLANQTETCTNCGVRYHAWDCLDNAIRHNCTGKPMRCRRCVEMGKINTVCACGSMVKKERA